MTVLGSTICVGCGWRMADVDHCTDEGYPYLIDGEVQWLSAIPYGDESWEEIGLTPPDQCHDCGVTVGNVHHWGCDMADCPNCGEQLLGCECAMPGPGDPRLEEAA